jgi:uncharacterized protein (TIGR02001 family)
MKKILLTTVFTGLCFVPAQAAELGIPGEFSANAGFVTEYSFRGIAQSDETIAAQGGFDWSHDSGVYLGVWGSNVDFNDGDQATVEVDLYGGYGFEFKGLAVDIGAIYYAYPGANSSLDYDFWEAAVSVGHDFEAFALSASLNYSPDFFASSDDAYYAAAYLDVPLPHDFSLSAHVGYQDIEDEASFGVPDYYDWSVGLGYNLEGFDLALTYVDTDLDEPSQCADGCEDRVIFSISRSF